VVLKWQSTTETLKPLDDKDEEERYKQGVRKFDFDRGLAPFPLETVQQWHKLTLHFSPDFIAHIQPFPFFVTASPLSTSTSSHSSTSRRVTSRERQRQDEHEDSRNEEGSIVFRYSEIPEILIPVGASPPEVTRLSMDKSHILEAVIRQTPSKTAAEVLAQVELCFIVFVCGHSFTALQQWKRLISLISQSLYALQTRPAFFVHFLRVLSNQMCEMPADLFMNPLSSQNFLSSAFKELVEMVQEWIGTADGSLSSAMEKELQNLQRMLTKKFHFDLDCLQNKDDAPTIVD